LSEQEKRQRKPAFGCTRTSSATNLGEDKDSVPRQRRAIRSYANRAGYKVTQWFDDGDVKGADPIDSRPGFGEMIETIAANGCRTIIVETADRFARDLVVQESGYQRLKAEGSRSSRSIRQTASRTRHRRRCSSARSSEPLRSSTRR
jgi:DNA invertase Pin-like site-specific DNA recombinase